MTMMAPVMAIMVMPVVPVMVAIMVVPVMVVMIVTMIATMTIGAADYGSKFLLVEFSYGLQAFERSSVGLDN